LIAVVAARALEAVEDPSNSDEEFRRNVIRRKLLPAMRAIESSVESRLGTLARLAADESAFLESIANDLWGALNAGSSIPRAAVHDAHPAIARRLIRIWLRKTHGYEPTFERVEAIRELSARNSGGAIGLFSTWIVGKQRPEHAVRYRLCIRLERPARTTISALVD
jgi:tRNA(Ile)-lysidine synthase